MTWTIVDIDFEALWPFFGKELLVNICLFFAYTFDNVFIACFFILVFALWFVLLKSVRFNFPSEILQASSLFLFIYFYFSLNENWYEQHRDVNYFTSLCFFFIFKYIYCHNAHPLTAYDFSKHSLNCDEKTNSVNPS